MVPSGILADEVLRNFHLFPLTDMVALGRGANGKFVLEAAKVWVVGEEASCPRRLNTERLRRAVGFEFEFEFEVGSVGETVSEAIFNYCRALLRLSQELRSDYYFTKDTQPSTSVDTSV
jgi:hypothetical protein